MLVSVTEDMSKPSDLVQGTLDMLLLKILALEPMNGFAVSQRLKQVSGDVLQVQQLNSRRRITNHYVDTLLFHL